MMESSLVFQLWLQLHCIGDFQLQLLVKFGQFNCKYCNFQLYFNYSYHRGK